MSVAVKNERRQKTRSSLLVSAVVKAKENKDSFWKEETELISMSRMGAGSGDEDSMYHVGVAFAGKDSPTSYSENPMQSYRIAGMNEDGSWRIVEAKTDFVMRRHPRHWVTFGVLLSAFDADDKLVMDEGAKTENISASGAAVISNMKVDVGDSVTFDSIELNFSSLAVVRNRQTPESEDDLPKLHLEFINDTFPVEKFLQPKEKDSFDEA